MTLNNNSQKKSIFQKIFTMKDRKVVKEGHPNSAIESLFFSGIPQTIQSFRVFVATWNVGGKSPHSGLNLDDFLQVNNHTADIYILGFQEIVPLSAGNVLVIEDNEPAAKWLTLINQSLNKSHSLASRGLKSPASFNGSLFFQKPSLRKISKTFRTVSKRKLKSCNCSLDFDRKPSKDYCFCNCPQSHINEDDLSSEDDEEGSGSFNMTDVSTSLCANEMKYSLVASKQMVGIFVTIWMKKELVQHVGHMRISSITRGIMGCLGNKGCISVSMTFHQTSFCVICSHLASGEKEGDELRRNSDVIEILKNTQFPKICRNNKVPEKILDHDRIIWLGDLNYRIALSYHETKKLLEQNNWDTLLNKDQLKIEKDAGRVFKGWKEGKIYFAPTYKYSYNSDTYADGTLKSKRRTPAWCDRILWHGDGIRQLNYIRGESRFSDHRPVYSTFSVDVEVTDGGWKKRSWCG